MPGKLFLKGSGKRKPTGARKLHRSENPSGHPTNGDRIHGMLCIREPAPQAAVRLPGMRAVLGDR